jgi:hypothetical protein
MMKRIFWSALSVLAIAATAHSAHADEFSQQVNLSDVTRRARLENLNSLVGDHATKRQANLDKSITFDANLSDATRQARIHNLNSLKDDFNDARRSNLDS